MPTAMRTAASSEHARSGSIPEATTPRGCRQHPSGLHHGGLQHSGLKHHPVHRQNYHRGKQQTGQQTELHVGAAAQKMIPVAEMFRDRHHQQKQRGKKDQETTERPAPLAAVSCPPVARVADGSQCAPHIIRRHAGVIQPSIQRDTFGMACRAIGSGNGC
ncbi:MAG: hypothetical protein QOK38_2006 [Acidobacteriaceae bacterium]|nr:hypothetical protein [Acidobacteriaceae bacterium]